MSVRPAPPIPDSPFERRLSHPSSQPLVHVNRSQLIGNPWLYSHTRMQKAKMQMENENLMKLIEDNKKRVEDLSSNMQIVITRLNVLSGSSRA